MSFRRRKWLLRLFAPAFAALMLAGPAAARPMVDGPGGRIITSADEFPAQPQAPRPTVVPAPSGGFDWGDAGVGAAGTLSLLLFAGGSLLVVRQTRRTGLAGA